MTEEELDKLSVEEWIKMMDQNERVSHAVDLDLDTDGEESSNDDFGTIDLFKD
jgi:hypothetical protein